MEAAPFSLCSPQPQGRGPHEEGQSAAAQVGEVSGDSGEFLEQDFLAECVEGQVSPDVGANGSNLGKEESQLQMVEGSNGKTGPRR